MDAFSRSAKRSSESSMPRGNPLKPAGRMWSANDACQLLSGQVLLLERVICQFESLRPFKPSPPRVRLCPLVFAGNGSMYSEPQPHCFLHFTSKIERPMTVVNEDVVCQESIGASTSSGRRSPRKVIEFLQCIDWNTSIVHAVVW